MADPLLLGHGAVALPPAAWLLPAGLLAAGWGLYVAGVRRVRTGGRSWSAARTASALTGVLLVAAASSPVVEAAAGDARAHMVQHLLLGALGPLALVLGAPVTLLLSALPVPVRRPVRTVLRSRALHAVSHVGTAAALGVGGLYALYLTPLYALTTRSAAVHGLVHLHLLLAGCLYAWAVAGPDPAPRRPGTAVRVGAVVVAGGAHAFLAQLLYSRAPAWPPGGGHGAAEVQQAAQLMYYGGHLADLLLLTALFAAGYRRGGRGPAAVPRPARLHTS